MLSLMQLDNGLLTMLRECVCIAVNDLLGKKMFEKVFVAEPNTWNTQ